MESEQMVSKELVIKYLAGESTEAERLIINQWLKEKAENKKYFDEIAFLWKASGIAQEVCEENKKNDWNIILGKIGKTEEYHSLKSKGKQTETREALPVVSKKVLYNMLKVAAIFFLAFASSWAALYFLNKNPDADSLAYNQIMTTKGQKSQIILSDGTKVWLNSETIFKYPAAFNENKREVFLEGEAFFEVQKKDDKIPFLVKTSDIDIEVLGTSFNVMAYADEETIEATLVAGSINLVRKGLKPSPDQNVILKPNQKVTLIKKGSRVILSEVEIDKPALIKSDKTAETISPGGKEQMLISSKVNIELHTAWKDDLLVFKSETFENIAYKLERWYDVKIHIQNEELKDYRYTGKFTHKETLNQVLEILNLTTPINYTFKQNDLYIEKVSD
jgi:ferric-dicitrate binding protein FerR (iron transport regulator)